MPPALRQFAKLDKRVVLVGQGNKFELWDEAQWHGRTAQAVAFPAGGFRPSSTAFLSDVAWTITSRSCSMKPWRHWRSSATASTLDGTFGRGGHARAFSQRWGLTAQLIALDRDPSRGSGGAPWPDPRFIFIVRWFSRSARRARPKSASTARRRPARSRHRITADRRSGARIFLSRRRTSRHAHGPIARRQRGTVACCIQRSELKGSDSGLW